MVKRHSEKLMCDGALHTGQIKTYLMEGVTQPNGGRATKRLHGHYRSARTPEEGSSPLSYKSS